MIKFVNYKEEQIPIRVSYHALASYERETGRKFDEKEAKDKESYNMDMFEPLMFYSMESGYRGMGKKMKFKREDMFDILEECFLEFANAMQEFFPDTKDVAKNSSAPAVGNRQQRRAGAEKPKRTKSKVSTSQKTTA